MLVKELQSVHSSVVYATTVSGKENFSHACVTDRQGWDGLHTHPSAIRPGDPYPMRSDPGIHTQTLFRAGEVNTVHSVFK